MHGSIVVLGSSNTDMIVKTPRIPRPGETILGGTFATAAGGKGANQAVGAARAGGRVTFVARVGTDMFGDRAIEGFTTDGIDITHVVRDSAEPTGVALIIVDDSGENSIAVASGCNACLSVDDVAAARDTIEHTSVLLMQLEVPLKTVEAAAETAAAAGVTVILNPAPAQVLPDSLFGHIDILTPNEHEAAMLTGIEVTDELSAGTAARSLRDKGVETVLVTLGPRGVYVLSDGFTGLVPAFPVQAVDTTAAGDVFNGVFACALAEGRPLVDAIEFACAAAAVSVTRLGAQPSAPMRWEIETFMMECN